MNKDHDNSEKIEYLDWISKFIEDDI